MTEDNKTNTLLNNIYKGRVTSVQNYGAFVEIPEIRAQGLVHRSQVSRVKVEDVSEVLQRGDRVWCKVISIKDDNKIALSMKVVHQGNGTDFDPNGIEIQRDEQRRRSQPPCWRRQVIELDAVLKTTCSKCGTFGHLASDCFRSPDGKTYELLPDDDGDDVVPSPVAHYQQDCGAGKTTEPNKGGKKKKKYKKEKDRKKKRQSSNSSSSPSEGSNSDSSDSKKQSRKRTKSHSGSHATKQRKHY